MADYSDADRQAFAEAAKTELAEDLVALIAERYETVRGTEPRLAIISSND